MIPGPPQYPPKPPGDGAGIYNSIKPTLSDRSSYVFFWTVVRVADLLGLERAARNLDHYLDNVGTTLQHDPMQIMNDIPVFKETVWGRVQTWAKKTFPLAKVGNGATKTFVSPWSSFYATKGLSEDWFFALGGFSYSVAGIVRTRKTASGWTGQLQYNVYIIDWYNWDSGKSVTIGHYTFRDTELGRLHLVGLAQEYIVLGANGWSVNPYTGGNVPNPFVYPDNFEFRDK